MTGSATSAEAFIGILNISKTFRHLKLIMVESNDEG
jgi:hypothetical protein